VSDDAPPNTTIPPLAQAVACLRAGGLVAFPTETVYGLGASARDAAAIQRLFVAKGRPQDHPLIVHVHSGADLPAWARVVPETARILARAFWPGPVTMVLARHLDVPASVSGGLDTIAVRVPAHPVAQALLAAFGDGLAAPSANRFGQVSPTTAAHVRQSLGDAVDVILDGGPCRVGLESTIVDLTDPTPTILRPGVITREELENVLGSRVADPIGLVRAPGALPSHYAPAASVLVVAPADVERVATAERARGRRVAVLLPAGSAAPPGTLVVPLPRIAGDAARRLYAALREVDERGCDVAVIPEPEATGIGIALGDRLKKAAAPRY
jgi:L-threonylcarbamoyladenylate synthase